MCMHMSVVPAEEAVVSLGAGIAISSELHLGLRIERGSPGRTARARNR